MTAAGSMIDSEGDGEAGGRGVSREEVAAGSANKTSHTSGKLTVKESPEQWETTTPAAPGKDENTRSISALAKEELRDAEQA